MIDSIADMAKTIGQNLKAQRKLSFPGDTQSAFAARIRVGVATYSRMERGDPTVSFKHYLAAAQILECKGEFSALFTHPDRRKDLIARLSKERGLYE